MTLNSKISGIVAGCFLLFGSLSCVKVNPMLGNDLIPASEKFITRTFTVPIDSVYSLPLDSLSGYSSQRMTIGAVRDDVFGITRRCTALSLVPIGDTLDFGENATFVSFHFMAAKDTTSFPDGQEYIIQNLRVYELAKALDSTYLYSCQIWKSDYDNAQPIVSGPVIYTGTDSLSFNFTESFARKYMKNVNLTKTTVEQYKKDHPGIFICADDPKGNGGRLNFFTVATDIDSDAAALKGNYATLRFLAYYKDKDGNLKEEPTDTSFFFSYGATDFNPGKANFLAFNTTEHESVEKGLGGLAQDRILIEGGAGLKPMIKASHLRNLIKKCVKDSVEARGWDADSILLNSKLMINKATISLPYEFPSDYKAMRFYPQVLNPTMRVSTDTTVTYAGMTDASVSSANQGDVDRNLNNYHPDLSFHIQNILATNPKTDAGKLKRENVWFLILATETVTQQNSSAQSDYYSQLAYMNYYNQMLGGYGYGYGGYGYGYGDYGYDNYYNYYMMQSMYNSMYNNSTTSTKTTLDKDRYYNAWLRGPKADRSKGDVPKLTVTYSFLPKQ